MSNGRPEDLCQGSLASPLFLAPARGELHLATEGGALCRGDSNEMLLELIRRAWQRRSTDNRAKGLTSCRS
jgi:hypothetical protein